VLAVTAHGNRRQAPLPGQPGTELRQQRCYRPGLGSGAGIGDSGTTQEPQYRPRARHSGLQISGHQQRDPASLQPLSSSQQLARAIIRTRPRTDLCA